MEETKDHVLAAGREIMLAAQGALHFCKEYAEATASPTSKMQLVKFFDKAITVADNLGKTLVNATSITNTARSVAAPLFNAIGKEMKAEDIAKHKVTKKATPKPRKKTKQRTHSY